MYSIFNRKIGCYCNKSKGGKNKISGSLHYFFRLPEMVMNEQFTISSKYY
ncbi:MAG: hypothetical protein IJV56_03155 [Neisseriaceae bacterium]|nr:hypothetical protein [Neisseriaceae bacterium]MBQ9724325.1 hypothetical protein [Neisseriaceae bacterium]MBR1819687.1 hypothetical protein [Neisseriaceae bacterium]